MDEYGLHLPNIGERFRLFMHQIERGLFEKFKIKEDDKTPLFVEEEKPDYVLLKFMRGASRDNIDYFDKYAKRHLRDLRPMIIYFPEESYINDMSVPASFISFLRKNRGTSIIVCGNSLEIFELARLTNLPRLRVKRTLEEGLMSCSAH